MTSREYSTDLSDAQWKFLKRFIFPSCRRGRKIVYHRRAVLNAIFYLLRTGCQWRMLPKEFPPWKNGLSDLLPLAIDRNLGADSRGLAGTRSPEGGTQAEAFAAIIDSQTVKTTEVGGPKGYDGGKKINGRKRHIVVDTLGLLLAVVHSADQQDHSGACLVLYALCKKLKRIKVVFADTAYGRKGLPAFHCPPWGRRSNGFRRLRDAMGFEVIRKRWIVERTFAWIGRSRRHSKDYEQNPDTSEALIQIAMIQLMLKRLHPTES